MSDYTFDGLKQSNFPITFVEVRNCGLGIEKGEGLIVSSKSY